MIALNQLSKAWFLICITVTTSWIIASESTSSIVNNTTPLTTINSQDNPPDNTQTFISPNVEPTHTTDVSNALDAPSSDVEIEEQTALEDAPDEITASDESQADEPNNQESSEAAATAQEEITKKEEEETPAERPLDQRTITNVIVEGNKTVPAAAITDRIAYRVGEVFDPALSRSIIKNLYYELGRFRNITISVEADGPDGVIVYVEVEEKKLLKDVVFEGNSKVTNKEINSKINFAEIPAIDQEELKKYAAVINSIYIDKGYLTTQITPELQSTDEHATAVFKFKEGSKSLIKQIKFIGNRNISDKQLKGVIFSREDWILSFMDKSGAYHPDRLEADKHMIEQYYQNHGYLQVKVANAQIDTDAKGNVTLTFEVQEGDKYHVSDVSVSGNDVFDDAFLLSRIPIKPGDVYSREKIADTIKLLEFLWSDLGFLYTHIEPSVQPDEDTKTVSVGFHVEQGNRVRLNRLNIVGHKKTRDKIVRRQLHLEEGDLITNRAMESSKTRVESLGFFDTRDGVNWKITRLSEDLADLDLIVKEVKTGNAHAKIGFGGLDRDFSSPADGISFEATVADTNLFGRGIGFNLTGRLAKGQQDITFNLTNPWLFDKPIYGAIDGFHKRISYDDFNFTQAVNELRTSGAGTVGFVTGWRSSFFNETFVRIGGGIDKVRYENRPRAVLFPLSGAERVLADAEYQSVLDKLFEDGTFGWVTVQMGQDRKNHPMHPSRGYTWLARTQMAVPAFTGRIGFFKFDLDANWFTPLIGEYDLVFRLHGYMGFAKRLKDNLIPYKELYHIGGQASVRGFLYGEISPQFATRVEDAIRGDSIGGNKALFFNAELIFPIAPDMTMKGVLFYDGGSGWDNPYAKDISSQFLRNNSFSYRHSVGFGVRILQPMPIKVDWGFKIDPRKGEPSHEVHFSMSYDW